MLKKTKAFLTIMICALIISACDTTNKKFTDSNSITDNYTKNVTPSSTERVFKNLCGSGGLLANFYASNSQGSYYLETQNDSSSLIHYIDFKSAKDVLLTSDLATDLTSENSAVFRDLVGGAVPLVDENYLYVVKFSSQYSKDKKAQQSLIHRMDLDGRNRETITLPAAKGIMPNSTALLSENELFILTYDLLDDNIKPVLTKFDFSKNEAEDIYTFDTLGSYFAIGGFNEIIYFRAFEASNKFAKPKILALNLTTKTLTEPDWSANKAYYFALNENIIYFFDDKSDTLSSVNLKTGEPGADVQIETLDSLNGADIYSMQNTVFDNKLLFEIVTEENLLRSAYYDLEKKVIIETDLKKDDGNSIFISAESDDNFLVYLGQHIVIKERFAPDGTKMNTEVEVPKIAIISKHNFWNSINNMKIILN